MQTFCRTRPVSQFFMHRSSLQLSSVQHEDFEKHNHVCATPGICVRAFATEATNYYQILQVTPKATNAQVKASYFRLSKKFHPDINKSVDAAKHFSQIAEAYEVLGNSIKRRNYDRTLFSPGHTLDPEYQEFIRRKGRFRGRSEPMMGRTHHYDFDEFYRQHYGDFVHKAHAAKHKKYTSEKDSEDDHTAHMRKELRAQQSHRRRALLMMALVLGTLVILTK